MLKQKRKVWLIFRDLADGVRQFYTAATWPHMPAAWSTDPQKAHEYSESQMASGQREYVSAYTAGASIQVMSTGR